MALLQFEYNNGTAAKLKNTIFGTTEFKAMNVKQQAEFIKAHADSNVSVLNDTIGLANLTHAALDYLGTVILRSDCSCQLVQLYYDESTETRGEYEQSHDSTCHLIRLPINEDLSESTLRRRQRSELLSTPELLRLIEEESFAPDGLRYHQ